MTFAKAGSLLEALNVKSQVSPLLANIALNGIESLHGYKTNGGWLEPSIRYADDMVIILRPNDDAEVSS
jgi:hypothetical protein